MTKIRRQGRVLEDVVRVKATPMQAWEAWALPERVKDWFVDDASGEPKEGEMMRWAWTNYGMDCPLKVLESKPGERIVFEWPMPQGALVWEIDIKQEGGESVVRVVSSGFGDGEAWDEQYEGQKHGWPICMAIYKAYLEGHFGRRRRDVVVMRPLERPAELAAMHAGMRSLAREKGRPWSGALLVDSGREICVKADGIGGLVTFKAVGGCGTAAKMAVIHASGWSLSEPEAKSLRRTLDEAVDRLVSAATVS